MFGLTPYRRNRNDLQVYDPIRMFDEFERNFFGERNLLADRGFNNFGVDICDKGDFYLLEADMPGFKKEDIKIDIEDGYLTISGERNFENEEKDKQGNVMRHERSFGSFSRSFNIADVKEDEIRAEYKDGVLKLNMPKKKEIKQNSRRLEIE